MGLEADIARIVENAVRKALADHVCSCPMAAGQGHGSALPRVAYSVVEVSDRIGLPVPTVRRMIREEHLKARWTGRQYVIPVGAVEEYLATADRPD